MQRELDLSKVPIPYTEGHLVGASASLLQGWFRRPEPGVGVCRRQHKRALCRDRDYAEVRAVVRPTPVAAEGAELLRVPQAHASALADVRLTFRQLIDNTGIGADAPSPPRLHDLRHGFAVRTLLGWYRSGEDVQTNLPSPSTYVRHREPACTHWSLSATPELLVLAAGALHPGLPSATRCVVTACRRSGTARSRNGAVSGRASRALTFGLTVDIRQLQTGLHPRLCSFQATRSSHAVPCPVALAGLTGEGDHPDQLISQLRPSGSGLVPNQPRGLVLQPHLW